MAPYILHRRAEAGRLHRQHPNPREESRDATRPLVRLGPTCLRFNVNTSCCPRAMKRTIFSE
jgi:hypothetical protein